MRMVERWEDQYKEAVKAGKSKEKAKAEQAKEDIEEQCDVCDERRYLAGLLDVARAVDTGLFTFVATA